MADYDEDAVLEAIARLQPQISALSARIQVLETNVSGGGVDLGPLEARVITLENKVNDLVSAVNVPISPVRVIGEYADGVSIIYEKV